MRRAILVLFWLALSGAAATYLALSLSGDRRRVYLPGATTGGHHQIESRCELCHDGGQVDQNACVRCHAQELAEADDSHPLTKFLDPRNAALAHDIDGRRCVSCHAEHRPSLTGSMGVSQPVDFCRTCHADIARERPSHRGMAFSTCQSAGCHNYHDNRALAESFLAEHAGTPDVRSPARVPSMDPAARYRNLRSAALGAADHDAPPGASVTEHTIAEWAGGAHARAGVNCTGCHGGAKIAGTPAGAIAWTDRPPASACQGCHADEVTGFAGGKHGMREAAGLPAMHPALARLPMRADAADRALGCASCHGAHAFDRRRAAVDACLACHADRHSRAYIDSPHHALWKQELADPSRRNAGVSCATCHLPRVRKVDTARPGIAVEHNQNAALRPVETMVRPVCLSCHGAAFSLAALADRALIDNNFRGRPDRAARSIDMARARRTAPPEEAAR